MVDEAEIPSERHPIRHVGRAIAHRRAPVAVAVSLAVHLAAAGLVAAVASAVPVVVSAFGNHRPLSITASFADESEPAAVGEETGAAAVVVMPTEVWLADRHFVSTLATARDRADEPAASIEPPSTPETPPDAGSASRPVSERPRAVVAQEKHPAPRRRAAANSQPAVAQVFLPPPDMEFIGRPCRYPEVAELDAWQGTVELLITIAADGTLTDVGIYRSSGNRAADAEAVQTVRTWRAVPTKPGGKLWATQVRKPIIFQLPSRVRAP